LKPFLVGEQAAQFIGKSVWYLPHGTLTYQALQIPVKKNVVPLGRDFAIPVSAYIANVFQDSYHRMPRPAAILGQEEWILCLDRPTILNAIYAI
jgi:hypothetical protein